MSYSSDDDDIRADAEQEQAMLTRCVACGRYAERPHPVRITGPGYPAGGVEFVEGWCCEECGALLCESCFADSSCCPACVDQTEESEERCGENGQYEQRE